MKFLKQSILKKRVSLNEVAQQAISKISYLSNQKTKYLSF
ncbi:unnamed protein product [Paramecium octaurelia]|uniref:Uncharacterized protein n=1 Tax=Paramecium octaurelia TaxID=43137 RepID=A0A8S1X354_PAROT|nr:unnamed protein product [Paramecium octaurelia]